MLLHLAAKITQDRPGRVQYLVNANNTANHPNLARLQRWKACVRWWWEVRCRVTSSSARGRFYLELNPKASVKTRLCGVGSAQCYKLFIEKGRRAGHQSANSRQLRRGANGERFRTRV
ncbi:hypothetical protein CEXT_522301 [Caerostris extrusa]|uniref:Uncharacterized protein n=1 Tax=Caerostris extrusa TaxID=172846 RepID=A0AAV4M4P5_CAEEX|nr:hypothetical protein CEXT_522301 [Caerostris extrusa]